MIPEFTDNSYPVLVGGANEDLDLLQLNTVAHVNYSVDQHAVRSEQGPVK